jgi:predicted nuclease of predicted toxin-antitoxin system
LNFLADENLDRQIVECLRQDGHIVWYVAEMEPGISDDIVLDLANQEGALLLTFDKDFGELVFRLRRIASGVVLIRLSGLSTIRKAEIVTRAINQHTNELLGAFTVITPTTIRIRKIEN